MKQFSAGLIAEIMSEGKRMTYEELCNAVLPVCFIDKFIVIVTFSFSPIASTVRLFD